MKNLVHEDIPCWYDLRVDCNEPHVPTLIVSIHEDVIEGWKKIDPNCAFVTHYSRIAKVPTVSFYGGLDRNFGFNGVLRRAEGSVGNFVDFSLPIPPLFRESKNACKWCKGKKERDGRECLYCEGTGKEREDLSDKAYAAAASLAILFAGLYFPPDKDTSAPHLQLFTVQTMAEKDSNGASTHGMFSPALVARLGLMAGRRLPRVELQMRNTYLHCIGRDVSYDLYDGTFGTQLHEGLLHLNCPGSATGLDPNIGHRGAREGYEFSSHNLDSLPQQFTLLAGLGRLNVDAGQMR